MNNFDEANQSFATKSPPVHDDCNTYLSDKFRFRATTHEIDQIAVHNTKAMDKGTPYCLIVGLEYAEVP